MVVLKKQFILETYTDMLMDRSCLVFSTQGVIVLPSFSRGKRFKRLNVKLGNLVTEPAFSLSGLTYCISSDYSFDLALIDFAFFCKSLEDSRAADPDLRTSIFFLNVAKLSHYLIDVPLFESFISYFYKLHQIGHTDPLCVKSAMVLPFLGAVALRFPLLLTCTILFFFKLLLLKYNGYSEPVSV